MYLSARSSNSCVTTDISVKSFSPILPNDIFPIFCGLRNLFIATPFASSGYLISLDAFTICFSNDLIATAFGIVCNLSAVIGLSKDVTLTPALVLVVVTGGTIVVVSCVAVGCSNLFISYSNVPSSLIVPQAGSTGCQWCLQLYPPLSKNGSLPDLPCHSCCHSSLASSYVKTLSAFSTQKSLLSLMIEP